MSKNRRTAKNNRLPNGQFPPGMTGNPHGRPRLDSGKHYTTEEVQAAVADAVAGSRLDGWYNVISSLGTDKDKSTGGTMGVEPVSDEEARMIYRGDSFGARIAEARPREMFRAGWKLKISDADVEKVRATAKPDGSPKPVSRQDARAIKRRLDALASKTKDLSERAMNRARDLEFNAKLKRALVLANVDGGSAILIGANDGSKDWRQPLNVNALRREDQLQWLTVVEAKYLEPVAWYNNPRAPKYGEVAIWRITPSLDGAGQGIDKSVGVSSPIEVHESRLIVFQGIKLTDSQVEGTRTGFGDSIYTRLKGTLSRYALGWNAAAILLNEFSLAVMKIKGLSEMASQDAKRKLMTRMAAVQLGRSIARLTLLDKDEELTRDTATLTGLSDLLFALMQELAGEADVPVTILMGMSPAGMNATGESDIRGWYDRIASEWNEKLDPPMRRLLSILLRTINNGKEPEKWCVELNPLWQESPKEKAETRRVDAETDEKNILNGIYSAEEARRSRFGGDEYGTDIVIDSDDALEMPGEPDPDLEEAKKMEAEGALGRVPGDIEGNTRRGVAVPLQDPNAPPTSSTPGETAPAMPNATDQKPPDVSKLLEVVQAVTDKSISRVSGLAILKFAFKVTDEQAAALVGPEEFEAPKPPPPPAFGAKPPIAPPNGAIPNGKEKPEEKPEEKPPIPNGKE